MGSGESKPEATGQQSSQNQQPTTPTSIPASRPAESSTIRSPAIGTSTATPSPTSRNVNINTATDSARTPAENADVSYQTSSTPFRTITPDNITHFSPQNVKTESRSSDAIRHTVASNLQPSNMQSNLQQTRSVEENVKNFDDVPEFPTQNSIASELLNVRSTSSAAKIMQAPVKNLRGKGIAKHNGLKKNVQGNKAEFVRNTISEIENGFNLVTLQDNNKARNAITVQRTPVYWNTAQYNGLSRDAISCPICKKLMLSVVFQCHTGHAICEGCFMKLTEPACPACHLDMRYPIRNRALENLIAKMKIPCENRDKGCIFSLPPNNLSNHLDECIYRTMSCPTDNIVGRCFWKGHMKDLENHFQNAHATESGLEPSVELTVQNVNVNDRTVNLIVLGKFYFLLHVKVDRQQKRTCWLIQNVGTKNAAKNWFYEFHFYKKSELRRKLFYAEYCSSDSENADALFKSLHCAVVPNDVLATFLNEGKLNYKFYIKKTDKERYSSNNAPLSKADPSENLKKGSQNYQKQ